MGYTVPNWAQKVLAQAVGINPSEVTVVLDNDIQTVYQDSGTRDRYLVSKRDGKVSYDKNESVVRRSDHKRERPTVRDEGFL